MSRRPINNDRIRDGVNSGIIDMIDRHAYECYYVRRIPNTMCTCVNHATKQANPDCPKCLGLGRKIEIGNIWTAAQDTKLPPTFRSENFVVVRNYYMQNIPGLAEEDYIIDNGFAFKIFEIKEHISLEGTIPYHMMNAAKKKFDSDLFMKNFNNIINARK